MHIRKIAFIEAGAPGTHMFRRFAVARVGTVLLATLVREKGYDVEIAIEDIAAPDWSRIEQADLVCISTLTPTALRAYTLADRVRAQGIPVVMGGAHPTFLPEEALQHADFVVRGEGERSLPALLAALTQGATGAVRAVPGLSWRDKNGGIVHNPAGTYLSEDELSRLPVPDYSLVRDWRSSTIYPVSTSRGCPFDCTFCSVIGMFGRKYRFKAIESVLKELRHVQQVSRATRFFVDDNFTADRKRSKELLRALIAEGMTSPWSAQTRTDVARDRELLGLMKQAGAHTLYIGFESVNPRTLAAFNKKQDLKDITECITTVREHGMAVHGMFVVGADTDDRETIRATADFAVRSGIETAQIVALTPLPGTRTFEEMERQDRMLHRDWNRYNMHHVVFKPAQMSPEVLQREMLAAMQRFYSWRYIAGRIARFDLHYAAVGLYGKRMVNRTIRETSGYAEQRPAPA